MCIILFLEGVCCYARPALLKRIEPVRWASDVAWATSCLISSRTELALGRDVEVRPSGGKGQGVFALKPIGKGQLIGRYQGIVRSDYDYSVAYEHGLTSGAYIMTLGDTWVLDGDDEERSAWTRFVNHSKRKANCASYMLTISPLEQRLNCVYFEATRDIASGEEILVDYGEEYWDSRIGRWSLNRLAIDYL